MKDNRKPELTKQQAEDIAEMLGDRKEMDHIYKTLDIPHARFVRYISESVFFSAEACYPTLETLRKAILDVLLRDHIIKTVLRVIETPNKTIKVTSLLNLSTAEKKALEKQGYVEFIKAFEGARVTLKVEETEEVLPPISLLEKLMKLVESDVSVEDVKQKLMPFNPVHPDTPEV